MIGLALAYLRDRAATTALNIVLLATAVAMLVLLLIVSTQLGDRFERDARGVDLVVGAKGSPLQLILSSIYQVDQPTGNIPLDSIDLLRRDPGVARVVPLALGDNFRGFRVVGTEDSYLALHDATLARGRLNRADGETVIGADVARRTGATLGQRFLGSHGLEEGEAHEEHPFIVAGILRPTGGVIDRLILTSIATVWDVHGITHDSDAPDHIDEHMDEHWDEPSDEPPRSGSPFAGLEAPSAEVTALLVTYRNAAAAIRLPATINRQTGLQAAVPAIETARLLSLFGSGIEGARVFGWLLAINGGLAIFVALLNAARAREGDLALLRVMGATRYQVFGTILLEGVITAGLAAVAGALLAHGLLTLAVARFATLGDLGVDALRAAPGEPMLLTAVLGIGALAALIPAARVFRVDLATTLSRSS